MKRWEAWSVHISTILVAGTGLVYAVMRYLMAPTDPFAVVNHPLQPQVQHLHVLVGPLLVFGAGLVWKDHVWKHYKQGVKTARRSGISMLLTIVPMVVSGYLIQTTVTEGWRTAWIGVHLVTSAIWLLGYFGHAVDGVRRWARKRSRRAEAMPSPETGRRSEESPAATA